MKRRQLVIAVFLSSLSVALPAAAEKRPQDVRPAPEDQLEKRRASGEHGRRLGIDSYVLSPGAESLGVELLGPSAAPIGKLSVSGGWEGQIQAHFTPNAGQPLTLNWDPALGHVSLMTESGISFIATADPVARTWVMDDSSRQVFQSEEFRLITAALADLEERVAIPKAPRVRGEERPDEALQKQCGIEAWNRNPCNDIAMEPIPGGGNGGFCTGPWYRGSAYNFRGSRACAAAREDVNYQCWNRACIGCCDYRECDKICLQGDFYCYALIDGKSCAPR